MKKTLLSLAIGFATLAAQAQVVTYVLEPAEFEGPLEFTWAENWGQTPDLNDPANQITGEAVFVDDGTGATAQQGCNSLVNAADIAGKIAVVYRGTCEFGLKAWNAQQAGAIGVVIVNNAPGAPIAMGAGVNGPNVTIPVVMITMEAGAMLADEIAAGNVVLLIGSVLGVYEYNLSTDLSRVAVPNKTALPSVLTNGFQIPIGTWVRNFGSQAQTDVAVNVVITSEGGEVYNETSPTATLAFDQEAYFALPTFNPGSFNGGYTITYNVISSHADEFPDDNTATLTFLADELMGYGQVDLEAGVIVPEGHYRASSGTEDFMVCSFFRDDNASQLELHGIWTSLAIGGGASVEGEYMEVHLYEWNDPDGPDWSFNAVDMVEIADYEFTENLSSTPVFVPFANPYPLVSGQKYLLCAKCLGSECFLGMGDALNYEEVVNSTEEPTYIAAYSGGGGLTYVQFTGMEYGYATVAGEMRLPVSVPELNEVRTVPFPNPATDLIRIPLNGFSGKADLQVFDLAGNKVSESRVALSGESLTMNVGGFSNGVYIFQMNFDNGQRSTFRVVVTK